MGTDYALDPPPPPPIWEQVKAMVERNKEMADTIHKLTSERNALKDSLAANDKIIATQARELAELKTPKKGRKHA